ncbi:MAG: glycerophosphodiester phosphodiesterase [Candidatus Heimdallarchaeaceae archaeon]
MSDYSSPIVIAHRGASEDAYQNTMKAFDLAIQQKADMIELDTHLTSDGNFIVHHDPIIRFEDFDYIISETKLEAIQNMKLPSSDDLPLLEDVLVRFLPKIKFNIEIKCAVTQKQFDDFLNKIGADTSRIIVSSFLTDVMIGLSETPLDYSLAYLFLFPPSKGKKMAQKPFISAINPYYRLLSSSHVEYYHSLGKKVYPWTINRQKDIQKLVKKKVDGIITDCPKKTRDIIKLISKEE